jgi:argininosuccinate lyase
LQEDKRPTFEAFSAVQVSLYALAGAIATATFRRHELEKALTSGHLCATDLADLLVQKGLPFREAHHVVGGLVREAEQRGCQLGELPRKVIDEAYAGLDWDEVRSALDPAAAVERRTVTGGPAKVQVSKALERARILWSQ